MGSLISFFRRPEQDTNSQLETIDTSLKRLFEKRATHIRSKADLYQKTRNYGVSIFVLLVLALYILFPAQLIRRAILLIFVFIIYPVAVLLIRKFWKFYHERQKKETDDKIKILEKQKEEILETVMEKEPYNKAREILKKFAPALYKKDEHPKSTGVQRQKMVDGKLVVDKPKLPVPGQNNQIRKVENIPAGNRPIPADQRSRPRDARMNSTVCHTTSSPVQRPSFASPQTHRQPARRPQTVRPLPDRLNQSRVDKIVGWVVGSNPEQMYALICKSCFQHNGLALKEEFEYLEFKCAYCHFLNPARKERPRPPRLAEQRPCDKPRTPVSRGPSSERAPKKSGETNKPEQSSDQKPEPSIQKPEVSSEKPEINSPEEKADKSTRPEAIEGESVSPKREEDSGTESDQMEKQAEESVLEESILTGGPDINGSDPEVTEESDNLSEEHDENDETIENEEISNL